MRSWRLVLSGAIGLLVLVAGTGCGGAPDTGSVAGERPTDIATPTDTPSEPTGDDAPPPEDEPPVNELPPVATEASRDGAEAFTNHVVALFEHGYRWGEVASMRDACLDSCALCHEYADEYESSTAVGGWVRGDASWRVDDLRVREFADNRAKVDTMVTIGEHEYADSAADDARSAPERSYAFTFELSYTEGAWHVADARLDD